MAISTIYRGVSGSPEVTFSIGDALTTAQNNDDSLNITKPERVTNVTAIRLLDKTKINSAETNGYYTAGDGGHGLYWYDAADTTSSDNGGTVIVGADGARWKLQNANGIVKAASLGVDFTDTNNSLVNIALGFGGSAVLSNGTAKVIGEETVSSGTSLTGVAGSKVRFSSTTTTSKVDFKLTADDVNFSNFYIEHDGVAAETAQVFELSASKIRLSGLEIDTNHTAGFDNAANAFQLTNTNASDIRIEKCNIHNVNRIMLRSNSTTGTLSNFWFSDNYCHDLCEGGIQFNFPLGAVSGIAVVDNYFDNFLTGTEKIFMGGSCVNQAIFSRNITKGDASEGLHLEEGARDVIAAHSIYNHNGDGLSLTDNNVSGSYLRPERISILGNIFSNGGTLGTNTGIKAQENGAGIESCNNVIISDNQFYGYLVGMNLGLGLKLVQNNVIASCTTGMKLYSADPNVSGNSISNATTGISITARGGLIGKNTFTNVTTPVSTAFGEAVSMTGFIVNIDSDVSLPATTTTNVNLGIPVGLKFHGSIRVNIYLTPTSYQTSLNTIDYDGATLTSTQVYRSGAGSVTFGASTIVNNGGQIAVAINNTTGSTATLKGLSVDFDGMWTST